MNLILYNANVVTLNPACPRARTVVIAGDKITAVEDSTAVMNRGLTSFSGKNSGVSRMIDCEGNTIIPGFNDAHCHPLAFAASLLSIDCSGLKSIAEIQSQIRLQAERTPHGEWIKALGYHEYSLAEKRHPTRWELDEASPYHPVKLNHQSGHACVLNSLAMGHAGISGETPEPQGAIIDRDLETGEPNGILFGMNEYVDRIMPRLSAGDLERGVELANTEYLSHGITSLQDATWSNSAERWETLRQLKSDGSLVPRISMMIGFDEMSHFQGEGLVSGKGDEHLRLGAVKIVLDEVTGALNPTQSELNHMVHQVCQCGYWVALHAIEENTVRAAIEALEYTLSQSTTSILLRIEHCSECPPRLLYRLKNIGAMIVTQPAFLYYSGERYMGSLSETQLGCLYRIGSFLRECKCCEKGVRVAISSDSPVVPLNPLMGIYAAVTRETEMGRIILPHEKVSPAEALQMYTLEGAYASGEEGIKGSITPGMLADLVVLDADPTEVPPEEIRSIRVVMTIVGGEIVWEMQV